MLDGSPLPANSSIRDFQQGKAGYVANVVKQALLLPDDMANLRTMKRHEVFLGLKRNLAMVSLSSQAPFLFVFLLFIFIFLLLSLLIATFPLQAVQATFRADELVNITHRQM